MAVFTRQLPEQHDDGVERASEGAPRWRWALTTRRDLLVPVVGLVALVVYLLHGRDGLLSRDLAVYSYAGQEVADGVPPYVGILNRAGPLAHLLPGVGSLLAELGGFDQLATMRLLFLGFAVAAVCATYVLGRELLGSRAAGLVAAAAMLSFYGFVEYASNGPREKTPMVLFIVCALLALTRQRWFTAGVFASLATLCLQTAFFVAVVAVGLAALLLARRGRARAVAMVVAGGATPVALYLAYAAATGSLHEAVEAFVGINARYTTPDPLMPRLDEEWELLREAYGTSLWIGIAGLATLGLAPLAVLVRPLRRRHPALPVLAVLAVTAGTSLAWNVHEYDGWPDLFPVLPLAAVGVGALFDVVARFLPRPTVLPVALALSVAATGVAVDFSVGTRSDELVVQRASTEAVFDVLPDATVLSVEAPQPLVLTGRTNPTRHQMFGGGLTDYLDDTWPGGLTAFLDGVVEEEADLVVLGDPVSRRWWRLLAPDYAYVGSAPDWFWLARRSLGEERLAALREAALSAGTGGAPPMEVVDGPMTP